MEMEVFHLLEQHGHEQVAFCHDRVSGLKAIIAIHDTSLGPSLGGCRMWPYKTEDEALTDVLRLSEGMTYKSAAMGLDLGGGKAVIIGDPRRDKSEELFRAFGKFVQSLAGRYITAEDVSIGPDDLVHVAMETSYVVGLPGGSGNPSPATALGVFEGMKACLDVAFGTTSFTDRKVAVQGVGSVGENLCRHLAEAGARLVITDIFPDRLTSVAERYDAEVVDPDAIYSVSCDVFSPNALGAVINDDTVAALDCRIVAGAANNQLAELRHGEELRRRGILCAPDFVINGGGVINVADEYGPGGYNRDRAYARISGIYDKVKAVLEISEAEGIPSQEAAIRMAKKRIEDICRLRRIYLP